MSVEILGSEVVEQKFPVCMWECLRGAGAGEGTLAAKNPGSPSPPALGLSGFRAEEGGRKGERGFQPWSVNTFGNPAWGNVGQPPWRSLGLSGTVGPGLSDLLSSWGLSPKAFFSYLPPRAV